MLNGEECQELGRLRDLAASRDTAVLQDVPEDMWKPAGWIVRRSWKPHGLLEALHQLEAAHTTMVSNTDG
jgi:hypothetical protein